MNVRPVEGSESFGPVVVGVRVLDDSTDLPLPSYATVGSSGVDLYAAVSEPLELVPLGRTRVPTGIAISVPAGWEAQIRPRSGLALLSGITVLNSPGTVDSDYRGELSVLLVNLGAETVSITRGDRIAQLVLTPVARIRWRQVDSLDETDRSTFGFGHTGR